MTPTPPPTRQQSAPGGRSTSEPRTATVTRLVPASAAPEDVGATAVQGALALDLRGETATPERRVTAHLAAVTETDLAAWAGRFAQAVVEAAGGDRPMSQLLRWTSPAVYADLERRLRLLTQATTVHRRRTVRPQVRSVHVCRPTAQSAEVSVHVRYGERSRALAARLDHRDGRWLCTALVIG